VKTGMRIRYEALASNWDNRADAAAIGGWQESGRAALQRLKSPDWVFIGRSLSLRDGAVCQRSPTQSRT
jgi:hypothetical protein